MEPKVINNDPDESYEDRLNEMYDDDHEENDGLMTDFLTHKTPDMNWRDSKPYSTCCGAQATGEMMDIGICPTCKDHCEFEWEEDLPEENITGNENELTENDYLP